jgi:hypothetical protein
MQGAPGGSTAVTTSEADNPANAGLNSGSVNVPFCVPVSATGQDWEQGPEEEVDMARDAANVPDPGEGLLGSDRGGTDELGPEAGGTDELGQEEGGTDELGQEEGGTDELGQEEGGTDELGPEGR